MKLVGLLALAFGTLAAGAAAAQPMTAEQAVQIALMRNPQVLGAEATVLDAKAGVLSSYSGVLPRVSADYTRSGSRVDNSSGSRQLASGFTVPTRGDQESYSTDKGLSGSWNVLDLSSISGVSSARQSHKAANLSRQATRNLIAFETRRQFYEVVKAINLASVADSALRLARDNERRVRALFEVGSVSKNDLLRAQVQTARSELDSLVQHQVVINQRITLSEILGTKESEMGEVDNRLAAEIGPVSEDELLAEAAKNRPDLLAAEAELAAARTGVTAARLAYLPYVTASGSMSFQPRSRSTSFIDTLPGAPPAVFNSSSESDRQMSGALALNWDIFTGGAIQARNASSKARMIRAEQTRDVLRRNLQSEVHQAVLVYEAAAAGETVAQRALESASEGLKLVREKYNVGSAAILDLIDSQVQLQRAAAELVSARAAIRQAEAELNRVRGRAE